MAKLDYDVFRPSKVRKVLVTDHEGNVFELELWPKKIVFHRENITIPIRVSLSDLIDTLTSIQEDLANG